MCTNTLLRPKVDPTVLDSGRVLEPSLELEECRKLDTERAEEMLMNLQPAIRKGNPRAIEIGVKLLDHMAKTNGFASPLRHELPGKAVQPRTLLQVLKVIGQIPDEN